LGYSLATDVAEWLVKQGVVFREAHEITGELVRACELAGVELHDASDELLASVSPHLTSEVRSVTKVANAIDSRSGAGGTALSQVDIQLLALRKLSPKRDS
jgi:argininosuccinate lyase